MRHGRVRRESDFSVVMALVLVLAGLLLCGGVGYMVWMLGRYLRP
jgi:preprotein translocase subunit Sss1